MVKYNNEIKYWKPNLDQRFFCLPLRFSLLHMQSCKPRVEQICMSFSRSDIRWKEDLGNGYCNPE